MKITRIFPALRLALMVCGLLISLVVTSKTAAAQESDYPEDDQCFDIGYETGCDVEGFSAVIADTQEIDSYSETDLDPTVADDGWMAYVEGDLTLNSYNNLVDSCVNEADPFFPEETDCSMVDSVVMSSIYVLIGNHGIDDGYGDGGIAGYTSPYLEIFAPTVTSVEPLFGFVGIPGEIIVQGSYLMDPFIDDFVVVLTPASNGNISGMTVQSDGVSPDGSVGAVSYTSTTCAGTGGRFINIETSFGYDNGDKVFTLGDPPPIILNVSPGVWQAGVTNLPVTITGTGFGDHPTLLIVGTGVTYTTGAVSDTQISATVSVSASAPKGAAAITVTSTGYCGSGFQPAYPGESPTGAYSVPVQPIPAPTPQLRLYQQNITGTKSVVVGQQMALDAVVTGATVQSQTWTLPGGTVVGGYTASTNGGGCVVLIQGQTSQDGSCTTTPVSTTNSSFAFYWVDSGSGSTQTVTYTYTATNGESASATATFSIDAPSGVTAGPLLGVVGGVPGGQILAAASLNPPSANSIYPILGEGYNTGNPNTSLIGLGMQAKATYLPAGGQYQWVQLLDSEQYKAIGGTGAQTCTAVSTPTLDTVYPYGGQTLSQPNDAVSDEPDIGLVPFAGEIAESFSATMYLMWAPAVLTGCPNGTACTMPVPQGNVPWNWYGDAINTMKADPHSAGNPLWILSDSSPTNSPAYLDDNSFPTWTSVWVAGNRPTCVPGR